jgi:hypothetical protein
MAYIGNGMYEDDRCMNIGGLGPVDPNPEARRDTICISWWNPLAWPFIPLVLGANVVCAVAGKKMSGTGAREGA